MQLSTCATYLLHILCSLEKTARAFVQKAKVILGEYRGLTNCNVVRWIRTFCDELVTEEAAGRFETAIKTNNDIMQTLTTMETKLHRYHIEVVNLMGWSDVPLRLECVRIQKLFRSIHSRFRESQTAVSITITEEAPRESVAILKHGS